ncbi:MAG: FecR family protein [Steroidobacteraceae bacterium]
MTDRIDESQAMSIHDEAAEWFIRWHNGEITVAERYAYLQWLKTSPVHIAELLRVCRMYSWLGAMKLPLYYTNEDTFTNIIELKPREATASEATRGLAAWRGRIAAGVALLAVAALFGSIAKVAWFDRTIETEPSEWRVFALADGSIVRAGPRTELRHTFGDDRRLVHLERGLAIFQVSKDPSRPFIVDAEFAQVTATGTQFEVNRRLGDEVRVVVSEGSVDVVHEHAGGTQVVSLTAGEKVSASRKGITPVQLADIARDLAWTEGWLMFERQTVSEAIDEFNHFTNVRIVVDPDLSERPVRGGFQANDPDSFADALASQTEGRVDRSKANVLRIEPAPERR